MDSCHKDSTKAITALDPEDWTEFSARYITDDGRVIDHAQHDVTHSEGQAYAMFFAVAFDDPIMFERVWGWTRKHLMRSNDGLISWLWREEEGRILDFNNATDADIFATWALFQAAKKWNREDYYTQASKLTKSLAGLQRSVPSGLVFRPGADGFEAEGGMVLNPSYWVFPAYQAMPNNSDIDWIAHENSALSLLKESQFGIWSLPPDWLFISDDGKVEPWSKRAARFSYDAIRIPLFLAWAGHLEALPPFTTFWGIFSMQRGYPDYADLEREIIHIRRDFFAAKAIYLLCLHASHDTSVEFPEVVWNKNINSYEAALQIMVQIAWLEIDQRQAKEEGRE